MTLKSRLAKLEAAVAHMCNGIDEPLPFELTEDERADRLRELMSYNGDDEEVLDRQRRMGELLERMKARMTAEAGNLAYPPAV